LVVLSACVTGLGKKVYFEVVGMKAAFKATGAKNTIVSLWKVDDLSTAVFMDIFYSYLKNNDIHTALWRTKHTMRTYTVGQLRKNGWLTKDITDKNERAEKLQIMREDYMPFTSEIDWSGFICQQN